jgi:hypothetical protein
VRLGRLLDRYGWAVFALFASVCLYSLLIRARAKPFWHDEIYTILHAGLPSLGAMWTASLDGFDLSPPLNTWITRAVHGVGGVGHISTRIPPLGGFLVALAVVFYLLRSRANTVTALAGVLLPCFTAAYRYAYEARGYGLMVGLFAVAIYAWSEAARERARGFHLVLLAAALAATLWNHYYGLLTFVPIAGGEIVRTIQRRRMDRGVAAAFAAALVASVPLLSLAAAARSQSQTFWSPASWSDVGPVYRYIFSPLMERDFAIAAIGLAILGIVLRKPAAARQVPRSIPAHEIAAGALMLLIPLSGVILGLMLTGVFVPRYAMAAALGLSLVVPLALWQRQTRGGAAEFLLCAFLLVNFGRSIGPSLMSPPMMLDPFQARPVLRSAVASGSPVISNSSLQFLQYWYYTPAAMKGRLRYLADVEEARKYTRSDTIDRGYLVLRRWTAVPIDLYDDYVAGHREFRVHEAGSGWLLRKLAENGASTDEIARGPGERLFLVRLP